ncbi:MAG: hypothetical protein A2042_03145 [Candidatus Schekmanbacteria bacterium GWA2_38_11]|uniref:Uncharacterized protein n=1 Tax=Candidatus Schekmanbacteria bacterium GWA2_38_11 TaxID=1817876 RepID=A0A1F7RPZ9_9BACT|nr:MAG: hypothetical protein A2042_03145 [Candidatus Schekmanbacteria bacterium GWA2_38_11]
MHIHWISEFMSLTILIKFILTGNSAKRNFLILKTHSLKSVLKMIKTIRFIIMIILLIKS